MTKRMEEVEAWADHVDDNWVGHKWKTRRDPDLATCNRCGMIIYMSRLMNGYAVCPCGYFQWEFGEEG